MEVVTGAKKGRLAEEGELLEDRVSCLPDDVLGHIVSRLPTLDGARTQVLSSRWRPLWRSAPLNLDLQGHTQLIGPRIFISGISGILSSHPGPGRRFSIPRHHLYCTLYGKDSRGWATTLDSWLSSPAVKNLQELELYFHYSQDWTSPQLSLPVASVHRFSSTLRVASFGGFAFPDDGNNNNLHLPLLTQLTLKHVTISESSLHALLAGCPVLQSLLLLHCSGSPRLQIVSPSLRSIGVHSWLQLLLIQDTPCLERLIFFGVTDMTISVISAPRLQILGKLYNSDSSPRLQIDTTVFQGPTIVSKRVAVQSVKVLAFCDVKLCLADVINLMKCFPCLEKLHIKIADVEEKKVRYEYRKLIGTLDICLRKVVLANYQGNEAHINFAKFFILIARALESMRLELEVAYIAGKAWIERQHRLLHIEKSAPRGIQIDFVKLHSLIGPLDLLRDEQIHDLSTDPFQRSH